jgi:uncharacterized surface protein with fasciclin (FAS1) repeats
VIDKIILSDDLKCGESVHMTNGEDTSTRCKNGSFFQKGEGNTKDDMPEIVGPDILACNGVIHVIDEVILPE